MVGKTQLKEINSKWGKVTESTTEIITTVKVYNPNPFPLPLKDILTEVYINGIKMGEGSALSAHIEPNSESTVIITTYVDNSKIPQWWRSHITNGEESTVSIRGYMVFDLRFIDFKVPFEITNRFKTDILSGFCTNVPERVDGFPVTVESVKAMWGVVTDSQTEIVALAKVRNEDVVPIVVSGYHYTIEMDGVKVADGYENSPVTVKPKSKTTLKFSLRLNNSFIREWWVTHIANGEKTKIRVAIKPTIEVGGRDVEVPVFLRESEFTTKLLS